MHLGWVALNWLVALASVWVSLRARRMYFRQVAKIFKPYAHSWVVFFEAKCPTTASAVAQLPIEQRTIFYLLYGFIATKGQGPLGTIKAEGTKAVDLAVSAGAEASANHDQAVQGAAGAGGKGTPAALPVQRVAAADARQRYQQRVRRSIMNVLPSSPHSRRQRSSPLAHKSASSFSNLLVRSKKHRQSKHHGGGGGHGHKHVHQILRALEIILSVTAFLISFFFLFWLREAGMSGTPPSPCPLPRGSTTRVLEGRAAAAAAAAVAAGAAAGAAVVAAAVAAAAAERCDVDWRRPSPMPTSAPLVAQRPPAAPRRAVQPLSTTGPLLCGRALSYRGASHY